MDLDKWWQIMLEPASLTVIENLWKKPVLALLNDTSHLRIVGNIKN
jgi:hypothetical protein